LAELSIIVPFVNEWPSLVFTLQALAEELSGRVDFEIIAINNWCYEVSKQLRTEDRGPTHLKELAPLLPWLKYLEYDKKLSHWQAKNLGVSHSSGKFLFFSDAHCLVSRNALWRTFKYYRKNWWKLNGTLHMPLTYSIMEPRKLIYKLKDNLEKGVLHYSFSSYRKAEDPYKVPCMSTCGMMLTRELFDELGGWPKELGIYGGGENFLNFSLAVMGKNVWIMPGEPLRHHGDKRGYSWNGDDYNRNRCIATYIFGGAEMATRFTEKAMRGHARVKYSILNNVLDTCAEHREHIKKKTVLTPEEWVAGWR